MTELEEIKLGPDVGLSSPGRVRNGKKQIKRWLGAREKHPRWKQQLDNWKSVKARTKRIGRTY